MTPWLVAGTIALSAWISEQQPRPERPEAQEQTEQKPGGLQRLSIEELSRISVVSAAKFSEPIGDAASAISVITGDMIRRSGVTTLPDALRLAVGVSVGRDGQAWAISARGFQASTANKMVVLVDGRSVYTQLFSGVFWDAQDLVLADVDRIEVIRGTGGTLWGANAVNGVINIVTKLAADTQGTLLEIGGGNEFGVATARYGGKAGGDGHFRVYGKLRYFGSFPYDTGIDPHEALRAGQAGFRLDLGPASRTSLTLQGDLFKGGFDVTGSPDGDFSGGNVLTRIRHTYANGAQVQLQAIFDVTHRRVPVQYGEWRQTGDVEVDYRFSVGARQEIVAGAGLSVTHDRVTSTPVFSFDPQSRTSPLLNVFVQDEIQLLPGRLSAIVGSKFEHNDYTGFEYQPTARVRLRFAPDHILWAGVSRAVRMPTRFDSDLRFTAGLPFVVLSGNPDFQSETVIAREVGYRSLGRGHVSLGVSAFWNTYDDLRSQEPTPPTGVPIVLGNKGAGRVAGVEIGTHLSPASWWQVFGGYAWLHERFTFDADSGDATAGSLEHNDPRHQIRLRSFLDLPGQVELDLTSRWVGALPNPAVPSYGELTIRGARAIGRGAEVEIIGDNLLHKRHIEFKQLGPVHTVPRSVVVRLTWRSR
jgi:iron complex outermembrane receptor protein